MVSKTANQRAMHKKRKASESRVGLYTDNSLLRSSTWLENWLSLARSMTTFLFRCCICVNTSFSWPWTSRFETPQRYICQENALRWDKLNLLSKTSNLLSQLFCLAVSHLCLSPVHIWLTISRLVEFSLKDVPKSTGPLSQVIWNNRMTQPHVLCNLATLTSYSCCRRNLFLDGREGWGSGALQ